MNRDVDRLKALSPRLQARFVNSNLYAEDMWNTPRVIKAFKGRRQELGYRDWNETVKGNSAVFNEAIRLLLKLYRDDASTFDVLAQSVAFASQFCRHLPDSVSWTSIFDIPVQLTDILGQLLVTDFIGYCACCHAAEAASFEMNTEGCQGLSGVSYRVARKIATQCFKCFDNLETVRYNNNDIEKFNVEIMEGDSND